MKNNNENTMVVYGENGEIISTSFNRIDFNNPSTILEYGSDVRKRISDIMENSMKLSKTEDDGLTKEDIEKITSFAEELEAVDKTKAKYSKGLRKFLLKFGIGKKEQEEKGTYKGMYEEKCRQLEELKEKLIVQHDNSKKDVALRQSIIAEMEPEVKTLEEEIKVAKIDIENLDEYIDSLKKQNELANDFDTDSQIKMLIQISLVAKSVVEELEREVISYKQAINEYRMQNTNETHLAFRQKSFIESGVSILKNQSSAMTFNKIQEDRIEKMQALDTALNTAMTENAKLLQANTEKAVELYVNGGLKIETLQTVQSALEEGMRILEAGEKAKQDQIARNSEICASISESVNEFNNKLKSMTESSDVNLSLPVNGNLQLPSSINPEDVTLNFSEVKEPTPVKTKRKK